MRSELRYCKEQDVIHTKKDLLWLYYTIIMLSHEAPATLLSTAISPNVRLQHFLVLSPRELTMVFTDGKGTKSYHDIKILDLPRLNEQGIEIGFEPLLQQMLESGKYEQGAQYVAHQGRETPDRNIAVRGHSVSDFTFASSTHHYLCPRCPPIPSPNSDSYHFSPITSSPFDVLGIVDLTFLKSYPAFRP